MTKQHCFENSKSRLKQQMVKEMMVLAELVGRSNEALVYFSGTKSVTDLKTSSFYAVIKKKE